MLMVGTLYPNSEALVGITFIYSLILHPVAREIKFNHLATSRNHFF
jgi:hypothetical protein